MNDKQIATEIGAVLDALATLSIELSCHADKPPNRVILPTARVKDICAAMDHAIPQLKAFLYSMEVTGRGRLPPPTEEPRPGD